MSTRSLPEIICSVRQIDEKFLQHQFAAELNELDQKLSGKRFNLVVTGLFKRGKSSVINALIGQNLAPVGVTPVTAVITHFEFGETTRCQVFFKDHSSKPINTDDIASFVSEEENPNNEKNVSFIRVFTNHSNLLKKCTIVDTPGLGSVFEHNTETTYQYIPRIDAALFVLSADTPVSKADAEFLRRLKSRVPAVIYVLNKTDLLESEKLAQLMAFNQRTIAEIIGQSRDQIEIVPVSCKLAETGSGEGNIGLLSGIIENLIARSKDEILLNTTSHRLSDIISGMQQLLKLQLEAINMPLKELEQKQASLKSSMELMNETRHEFDILAKGQLDIIVTRNLDEAGQKTKNLLHELNQQAQQWLDQMPLNGENLRETSDRLASLCVERLSEIKAQTEQNIVSEFNQLLFRHQSRAGSFLHEFSQMLSRLFGFSLEVISRRFTLDTYSSFYFLKHIDGQSLNPGLPGFYRLLPQSFGRAKAKTILFFNNETLTEVNKGRMMSDILYKVSESFRHFRSDEASHVEQVFNRIRGLLDETMLLKQNNSKEIELRIEAIENQINELHQLHDELRL